MIKSFSESSILKNQTIKKVNSLHKIDIQPEKDDDNISLNVNISSYSYLYENVFFDI